MLNDLWLYGLWLNNLLWWDQWLINLLCWQLLVNWLRSLNSESWLGSHRNSHLLNRCRVLLLLLLGLFFGGCFLFTYFGVWSWQQLVVQGRQHPTATPTLWLYSQWAIALLVEIYWRTLTARGHVLILISTPFWIKRVFAPESATRLVIFEPVGSRTVRIESWPEPITIIVHFLSAIDIESQNYQ